jgi:K+-sensing histidine kinase KdpD
LQERWSTIDERQLKINLPQQANFSCTGDRVLIDQTVANLLDNAIRFCNNDGQIDIFFESLAHQTRASFLTKAQRYQTSLRQNSTTVSSRYRKVIVCK